MSRADRGGAANGRRRRGPIVLVIGAVIFAVAGWQQVAQAAGDPAAGPGEASGASVSFAEPVPASSSTAPDPSSSEPTLSSDPTSSPESAASPAAEAAEPTASGTTMTSAVTSTVTNAVDETASAPAQAGSTPTPVVTPATDSVDPGDTLPIEGAGLTPGGAVRIVLDDAVDLAVVDVDADGTFRTDIAIPAETGPGEHVVSAVPVIAGSGLRSAVGAIRSAAPAAVASFPIQVRALPPGGAGSNTEGTTSTVSPGTVAIGGTLSFTVGGYPAGETVYVKIDDGSYQGIGKISGADIVATATIGSDGTASGSIVIPSDLATGEHTLRFLASAKVDAGTLGYTHKSDTFTVVAASSGDTGADPAGNAGGSGPTTSTTTSAGTTATGTKATTGTTATGTTSTGAAAGSGSGSTSGGSLASTGVDPVVGMAIGLGFMLAGAGMMIGLRRDAGRGHA